MAKIKTTNKNICIIGLPKCGQNSLKKYLKNKFPDKKVESVEWVWRGEQGIELFKQKYKDWQPIIILRNNVERIWSGFHFFGMVDVMDLETYLQYEKPEEYGAILPVANPIVQGDYKFWIDMWKEFNPIILYLEDLEKEPDFPHENKTEAKRLYPMITNEERMTIKEALTQ